MRILKNWKRQAITAMIIVLSMLIVGCGIVSVNEDKDRKLVVAEVNGEKILKAAVLDELELYTALYGNLDEDQAAEIKAQILDQLVNKLIINQKAKDAGFVLNDEFKEEARQEKDSFLKEDAERKKEADLEDEDKTPKTDDEYLKEAQDEFKKWLDAIGLTEDEYVERIAEDLVVKAYFEKLTEDLTVDEEEVKKVYDVELEFQTNYPSYKDYASIEIVTEPAMRRVKHILIKLDEEVTKEIEELRRGQKEDEANQLREEKLKEIKAKADEVLALVKAGEDFEQLIKDHGQDPGMENEKYKDGYTMLRDESMRPEFLEASFELDQDEVSDLVATDNGYHIIKVYEAKEAKIIKYEDIKEDLEKIVLEEKRNKESNSIIETWIEEAKIEKFEKRL